MFKTAHATACLVGMSLLSASPGASHAAEPAKVYTNQAYVEDLHRPTDIRIDDKMAVFSMVFSSLPDAVTVYPTENYYYFYFYKDGVKYAGNVRLDVSDRDKGLVHFNYFKDFTEWQRDETDYGALLGEKDGVKVTRLSALAYQLAYKDKTVRFNLNDLSGVQPPKGVLRANETYLGPVFDESGIRFFLVFNDELKIFHFVLDETVPLGDLFEKQKGMEAISLGVRTGFALIQDRFAPRRILVGVSQANTSVNNYLDGPFDQLPDNFLKGDALKDAILAASPEMEGQIDRLGNSADGETRYLIAPYMNYTDVSELQMIAQCAKDEALPSYYNCFSFAGYGDEGTDTPDDGTDPGSEDGEPDSQE